MIKFCEENYLLSGENMHNRDNMIAKAYSRIKKYIYNTPLIYCSTLSTLLGNKVFLKLDSMQITGAFKIRGVLNFLLTAKENGELPDKIVAYSTGNHALAMAYITQIFSIHARIYLPAYVSSRKKEMLKSYGAEIIEVENRNQAEYLTHQDSLKGYTSLPPSDNDLVIAGAGTMCYEALSKLARQNITPDAIFAPCGGGGLLSGSYLAKELYAPSSKIYGVEPLDANDAHISVNSGSIFRFDHSPQTAADGLRALSVSKRTLQYLQRLDDIYLIEESEIIYWNNFFNNIFPFLAELSATISLAAAKKWSEDNPKNQVILLLISGGNHG
jgi:threonine dehydratase